MMLVNSNSLLEGKIIVLTDAGKLKKMLTRLIPQIFRDFLLSPQLSWPSLESATYPGFPEKVVNPS